MRHLSSSYEPKTPPYLAKPSGGEPGSGLNGLTANWITLYGALTLARVSH